ncbi:MAG: ATP-binding protein, partial [Caldilineaceae bacterium]|nr:ATP-binding protein [Caldilineaceae bacterium]
QPELKTVAQLEIQALDEDGLLGDALGQIYTMLPRVTLHKAEAVARHGAARVRFILEAESQDVLDEIVDAMRRLPSRHVTEVRTTSLPFSEREELVKPVNNAEVNPYSRLPVNEDGMFFGRSQELNDLRNWLATRVGVIWLLGQKRVGKTSLLLHLKNRFLERAEFVPVFIDFQLLGKLTTASVFFEIATAIYNELQSEG